MDSLGTRPMENRKEGLGDRLGWKCTLRPECRRASNWFMIACLCTFIGNTNCNSLVQFKKTENKRDLLAREVVEHRFFDFPRVWFRDYGMGVAYCIPPYSINKSHSHSVFFPTVKGSLAVQQCAHMVTGTFWMITGC